MEIKKKSDLEQSIEALDLRECIMLQGLILDRAYTILLNEELNKKPKIIKAENKLIS